MNAASAMTSPWAPARGMRLPAPDRYHSQGVYDYVREWGEFAFGAEAQAKNYAAALETGEGGKWEAVRLSGHWRAHRVDMDAGGMVASGEF